MVLRAGADVSGKMNSLGQNRADRSQSAILARDQNCSALFRTRHQRNVRCTASIQIVPSHPSRCYGYHCFAKL